MSLDVRGYVRGGLNLAFDLMPASLPGADNVRRSGHYVRRTGASYDPVSGEVVPNDIVVAVPFLLGVYSEDETDGTTIQVGDEKVVVRMADLAAGGILTVGRHDIVREGAIERQVVNYRTDPTSQALILQTRKVGGLAEGSSSVGASASS